MKHPNGKGLIRTSIALLLLSACTHHDTPPAALRAAVSFATLQSGLISSRCATCHSGSSPAAGLDFSSYNAIMNSKTVVAGNPQQSSFYTAVANGSMPPGTPLAQSVVQSIASWIQDGAKLVPSLSLESVVPSSGGSQSLLLVTINGQGFQPTSAVTFGSTPASSMSYVSSNQLNAVTPPLSAGTYEVRVSSPDGTAAILPGGFTVIAGGLSAGISVNKVFPSSGPSGTFIEVAGDGFAAGATVTIGNQACVGTIVNPPNQITCSVPRQDLSGPADVVVTNPGGAAFPFILGFNYTVTASYTSILNNILLPKCGSCHGKNSPAMGIVLDNYDDIMASGTVIPRDPLYSTLYTDVADRIEPRAPAPTGSPAPSPAPLSTAEIDTIFNWILNGAYDDTPPTVTSITPNTGSTKGGSAVTIAGAGFLPGITVTIGSSACTPATINTAGTQIQCVTSPRAPGAVDVVLINTATGGITPLPSTGGTGLFSYVQGPTIAAITPNSVKSSNQSQVTVSGTGFRSDTTFKFGLLSTGIVSGTLSCDASANCTAAVVPPPQLAAQVTVRVTNADGQFFDDVNGFTYTAGDPPFVHAISPTSVYTGNTVAMTLTGTGFLPGATVTAGPKTQCSNPNVTSTQITCNLNTGNLTPGSVNVVVTNPDSNTGTISLTVIQTITITSISPATISAASGGILSITGKGFVSGVVVTVGGKPCTGGTQFNSSTSLACVAPAGTAGSASVVATNPDATTATATITYQ